MAEPIDRKKASAEDIEQGLALLSKKREHDERVKKGEIKGSKKWSEMTEDEKAKAKLADKKRLAKQKIAFALLEKNKIQITDKMIDEYLATGKLPK